MSYAYLFKYIIIGDTGLFVFLYIFAFLIFLQALGSHVYFFNSLIKGFNPYTI